jgi:ribosomal protein L37AE/L43A
MFVCPNAVLLLQGRGNGRMSSIDLKAGTGKGAGARARRKYPASDSEMSAIGQIATAANHGPTSTAQDRKTKGSGKHVPDAEKYLCELCNCRIVNKRDLIMQHEDSKKHKDAVIASLAAKAKRWHCETCNAYFPNTADAVHEHMTSAEHARMTMLSSEEHRDGPALAKKQRQNNANQDDARGKKGKQKQVREQ